MRAMLAPLGRCSLSSSLGSLRQATLSQIEDRFAAALPDSLLPQYPNKTHSRLRIFSVYRTFWCWLWQLLQGPASCREVVRQLQSLFLLHDAPQKIEVGTSAYCQARSGLPSALLETVFNASFRSAERGAPEPATPLLQNRPVRVVDGSGIRLADTPKNRVAYPPSVNLPAGTSFPILRLVVLFCLKSGALLAQASDSLCKGELRLFTSLFACLRPGDIVLGDRAYGIYVMAALLKNIGVDLIATVPARSRRVDFRRTKKRLGPHDALFEWKKPRKISPLVEPNNWKALPELLSVRLLRLSLVRHGFRTQHLVVITTLLDSKLYPKDEILATHARRWRMEMCLDDIKTTLGMESLRCQCPQMVQKELLVFLTAHNLVRWLMGQAAGHGRVSPECLSFKGTLDAFRQWSQAIAQSRRKKDRIKLWEELLLTLVRDRLPDRPGRHEPRAVKKRSQYPHLNTPRRLFKDRPTRAQRRRRATARKRAASLI